MTIFTRHVDRTLTTRRERPRQEGLGEEYVSAQLIPPDSTNRFLEKEEEEEEHKKEEERKSEYWQRNCLDRN